MPAHSSRNLPVLPHLLIVCLTDGVGVKPWKKHRTTNEIVFPKLKWAFPETTESQMCMCEVIPLKNEPVCRH